LSGRHAHGVEVGVVVEAEVLALLVPAGEPAPTEEVVGGGAAGAGVTFGVGRGTDKETYGSSVTLAGWTRPIWGPWAAATIRAGVSSEATANSA
jgi:hypothetical protein